MKTVAVIGAGSSGLTAIKACKEEDIGVVCFERSNNFGGLWCYRDEGSEFPSVMKTTVINTHKDMTAFSDFPPPDDAPNYMHNSLVHQYLHRYAENFDLLRHIRYNHEVLDVSKSDDYEKTGRWKITYTVSGQQEEFEEIYDGIMLCSGHHAYPNIPQIPGQNFFKGTILHSQSLKVTDDFKDLNVLVIGIGNSAVDAATELSSVAKQVYLSTRRGAWVISRCGPYGLPYDITLNNRVNNFILHLYGWKIASWLLEITFLSNLCDHSLYGLKPKHRALSQHPTISDTVTSKILTGRILLKGNVKLFSVNTVTFENENSATPIDAVVFATGYKIKFPFVSESILSSNNNKVQLYKLTFPPYLKHPSFAVIGCAQPVGSIFPIAEAQSRWFALLMNGKVRSPNFETMQKEICRRRKALEERYVESPRHTVQVDYLDFMDEISAEYGAKPSMIRLMFRDPILFMVCLFSPALPYQYRIQGPHSWPKARETLLSFPSRVAQPFANGFSRPRYSHFQCFKTFNLYPLWFTFPIYFLIFCFCFILYILY